eukprot:93761_1
MALWNTRRFVSMNILLVLFSIVIYNGHLAVVLMEIGVQLSVSFEVASIGIKPELECHVPYFNKLRWYILIIGHIYVADGWALMDLILKSNNSILILLFQNHILYSSIFTLFGFIYFVIKVNKHSNTTELIRYQYGQLAFTICGYLSTAIGAPVLRVTFEGLIWTVLPMLTVVANDVFAYGFGKIFGKHQLTLLSPKKTWEGYIYSAIATIPFGYLMANFFMRYNVLFCPKYEFSFGLVDCEPNIMFFKTEYNIYGYLINIEPFQIYNFVISIWIAIICPIGGFMASGYKRAFGLKNYGSIIPGHGGITDRMDAEVLMCGFVPLFYNIIMMKQRTLNVDELQLEITSSLTNQDVSMVIKLLESLITY